jgi:hypothetical protein
MSGELGDDAGDEWTARENANMDTTSRDQTKEILAPFKVLAARFRSAGVVVAAQELDALIAETERDWL